MIENILTCFKEASAKFEEAEKKQIEFWELGSNVPLLIMDNSISPENLGLTRFNFKEIHFDSKKMFENELIGAVQTL